MPADEMNLMMVLRSAVGGLFRHVTDLGNELEKRGHRVALVFDRKNSDRQTRARIGAMTNPPSLGVHHVAMARLLGTSDLSAALKIRSLARKLQIDIIHGHGAKGGFNGRIAAMMMTETAAVYTPHGGVLHYSAGRPAGKILHGIERLLIGRTDAMIFESAFAKTSFENQIGRISCPAKIIHNGLLPEEFREISPNRASHDFAFVGEIRHLKGIHILLQALVETRGTEGNEASLIIAGGGPDEERIVRQIDELGLGERVKMAGVKPARQIFEQARTVVVPSLAESLPYVVLEAAAAKKPLIATRVGGIAEIFGPTAPSLLPAGDAKALQGAMQANMRHPEKAMDEAKIRLEWVKERFSVEKMVNDIESTYQEART